MPKELLSRKIVDIYLLENFENLKNKKDWKIIVEDIKESKNIKDLTNNYLSARYRLITNKIKKGKTVNDLLFKLLSPTLSLTERRKIYNKKYKESEKGKILKEKMAKNPWHIRNKEYRKIRDKKYREQNKEKERIRARKNQIRLYGLTEEEYDKMFQHQKGCCLICGLHQDNFKKSFHIDHCHTTGKIRGLLCRNCNVGLGHFKDSIELLNKAIKYLNK